ncbi:hypothetical protein FSP39_023517 [Pinctada imbricata]|uniref:B box-type domain-containing protein n=1 Tax=Pinctada imbricata TaxID=66713 RepID=A0AA88XLS2_PINIB|nr:hypothetical protein FSP39_023517 [Pinctada imbricata]
MAALYQWQLPCLICGDAVEFHCNTCGDILCAKCRNNHLKSGASKNHKVVPYADRVEPRASSDCSAHPGNQYHAWCQRCLKEVCNECIFSVEHRGHTFQKLGEIVGERRKELQGELSKNEIIIKKWTEFLEVVKVKEKQHQDQVRQLEIFMSKRTSELLSCIKQIEEMNRTTLRSISKQGQQSLIDHKRKAEDALKILGKRAAILDDKLRSSDTKNLMARYDSYISPNLTNIPVVNLPDCKFTSGRLDQEALVEMYGQVGTRVEQSKTKVQVTKTPIKSKTGANTQATMKSLDLANLASVISAPDFRGRPPSKTVAFYSRPKRSASK